MLKGREKLMAETYVERVHTEHAVLDIGQDIGALIIYTRQELLGREIEVSSKGNNAHTVHTQVLERKVNGRTVFAALFLALHAGDYTIWSNPTGDVTIFGGEVAQVDWSHSDDVCVPHLDHHHHHD